MEIYNLLRNNKLFYKLTVDDIHNSICKLQYNINNYNKNEIIVSEEERCSQLGIILKGTIEIQRIYSNGKYILLKRLEAGDVFGEALMFNESNYPATIIAIVNCEIMYIKKEEFLKLCFSNKIIMENFMSLLSEKVIMLNEKVKSISFKSIRQKIVNYLLVEYHNVGKLEISLRESKEVIAAELGIPRPSLSRELINLREEGLIKFSRKNIEILDLESLEEEIFN